MFRLSIIGLVVMFVLGVHTTFLFGSLNRDLRILKKRDRLVLNSEERRRRYKTYQSKAALRQYVRRLQKKGS